MSKKLSNPAQHRLSYTFFYTFFTLGGQGSHPWWPSLFSINEPAQQEQKGAAKTVSTIFTNNTNPILLQ